MSGTLSVNSSPERQSANVDLLHRTDEEVSSGNIYKHIAKKAGYKNLAGGKWVQHGWHNAIRKLLEGNTAADRYRRAAYEGSQRNTAALLSTVHRYQADGMPVDDANLAKSELLQARVMSQDNARFNPELGRSKIYGLSARQRWGVTFARWAHYLNGITELCSAPTGMLLKSTRIATTPHLDDRSGLAQVRVIAALVGIAGAVSVFGSQVFGNTIGNVSKHVASRIAADVGALVAGFSAAGAMSALCSLVVAGVSNKLLSKSELSPVMMRVLNNNCEKHINRLHKMLSIAVDTPDAIVLLSKALQPKIGKAYRDESPQGQPVILNRLLENVRQAGKNVEQAKQAIRTTLGSYMVEKDINGGASDVFLDPKSDAGELLRRENHVVALTNLIEHKRIDDESEPEYLDLRHHFEGFVDSSRKALLGGTSSLLNVLGFKDRAKQVAHMNTKEYVNARDNLKKSPTGASQMRYSMDYMLDNRHQYGRLTRSLMFVSEAIRTFNHTVPLSLNYQLTRPIAWLAGRITEHVFKTPNSRTISFSIGRALASSIWAVVDAMLIVSPAAGRGLGFSGNEAKDGAKTLPWKIGMAGPGLAIGATSTAAQMVLISGLSFGFLLLASGAARLEGWKGNLARSPEPADSKRAPLNIGHLMTK